MITKETVIALAEERMAEINKGLFLVELSISASNVIHLEIDSEIGNVSIDDCIRVSRNVEHNLDREEEDFELSVSSAGLDKPLRAFKQYPKNIGRTLTVKTSDNQNLEGVLTAVTEKEIVIETRKKEKVEGKKKKVEIVEQTPILLEQIKEAKIVISFK
ncbi:MAG: ribosome assembly cofactor RimP [Crocinitomicaceae bacterium]